MTRFASKALWLSANIDGLNQKIVKRARHAPA
jgi:hypothetical protein